MSCVLCKSDLTDEELSFYRTKYASLPGNQHTMKKGKHQQVSGDILASHYVLACSKHRCECMESGTSPWRWIQLCNSCYREPVCKSCGCIVPDSVEIFCRKCFWRKISIIGKDSHGSPS